MEPTVNSVFTAAYEAAPKIDFNMAWSNGTGYFDHAVEGAHAPKIGNGKMVSSATPSGRRIIIVGTRIGNCVVFERYTDNAEKYVFNAPTALKHGFAIYDGLVEVGLMEELVGDAFVRNIGDRLDDLYVAIKRSQSL